MNKKTENMFFVSVLFVLILFCLNLYQCSNNKKNTDNYKNLITAIEDTLVIEKNKNNQYVSSIAVLTSNNIKAFTQLEIKNTEIQELQKTIKQYGNKVEMLTKFISEMKIDTVVKTVVEYQEKEDKPVYKWQFNDEWINLSGISNQYNTQFSLGITEKYDVAILEEKKQLRIEITNYNPYSITTSVQSFYKEKPRQKRVGIGPYIGYGYSANQGFGFEVGIGINYNIFYIW